MLCLPDRPRLLVICVARFGDTLLVTPVLRALRERWPRSHVTVLSHPKRKSVLEHLPDIDHLAAITKHRALLQGWLRDRAFDAALVYGEDSALFAYARRVADSVIGFRRRSGASDPNVTHEVPLPVEKLHAVSERMLLLSALDVQARNPRLQYVVGAAERAQAELRIGQSGWSGLRLVGFQLQSFPTKTYRDWPPRYFADLARKLLERYPDVQIVLLGGSESRTLARRLVAELGPRTASLAGALTMRENAAIIATLALYIGVDTGPTHLAGALGVRMVAMYHCCHRGARLAPLQHPALAVLEHPGEAADPSASMEDIPVSHVYEAACALLDRG